MAVSLREHDALEREHAICFGVRRSEKQSAHAGARCNHTIRSGNPNSMLFMKDVISDSRKAGLKQFDHDQVWQ